MAKRQQDDETWRIHYNLLQEAQRLANIGSWELDLVHDRLTWSDEIYRIFEIDPAHFGASYEAFVETIHPEDREMVNQAYLDSVRNRRRYEIEHRLLMPDGRVKYVRERGETFYDAEGKPVRSIGTVQDITEVKRAAEALEWSEAFNRALSESVPDGIVTIDEHGRIVTFNPAAERIFGYRSEEVIGRNVGLLMPEPHRSQHDAYLERFLREGGSHVIGRTREVSGQRKDGSVFPMELAVSAMQVGSRRFFSGLVRDISERKRMERLKDEFVAIVSHELRTPLTSIRGALGLIQGRWRGQLPHEAQPLLDIALKNGERLLHLIDDLLDLQKIAAGKMAFDLRLQPLGPIVEQAVHQAIGLCAPRKLRLTLVGTPSEVWVRVDAQRLNQVLSNFLSNAAKFSPEQGEIQVRIEPLGAEVRVTVTDQGTGIPEDFRARVFEKFAQADASDTRQRGGTGLGLAISKSLIEQMGGHIGFDSPPGQGASFYITLPVQAPPESAKV